ncbi:MAG: hypothetical protein DWQ01_03185 [Planctomycetota bacterium]|nr:MAG: hypothetical protein DWQ01_03185 [Planctomycetota bacterium]
MFKKTLWSFLLCLTASLAHAQQSSLKNNVVQFDVLCDLEIIDADWEARITVYRPNAPDFSMVVPLPRGTTEDAMATVASILLNSYSDDPTLTSVERVPNGPDKLIFLTGSADVTTVRSDSTADGHIKVKHSNVFDPILRGNQIKHAPELSKITVLPQDFQGGGLIFELSLWGIRPNGQPFEEIGVFWIPAESEFPTQAIVDALLNLGFEAYSIDSGFEIKPGIHALVHYEVSFTGSDDGGAEVPMAYGGKVEHFIK